MKDTTAKAKDFIENTLKLLPEDHRDYGYFTKFLATYDTAEKLADTDEKAAILYTTAIRVASQLASILFRFNLLTEEAEKAFREFPPLEAAEEEYHSIAEPRMKHAEDIRAQLEATQDEQMEIDIFIQVVNGRPEEEARERIKGYKNRSVEK